MERKHFDVCVLVADDARVKVRDSKYVLYSSHQMKCFGCFEPTRHL